MKISELVAELNKLQELHGDVDCYAYDSDYSNYYEPTVLFESISIRSFIEGMNANERKTIQAVSINP